ncbi:MAG: transcriptional repressor [Desulfarculaceae bacterium]|nr:transcriptional repressor [Desulfarculaceae bacterium]MCF8073071.1 transcriptional repressor [Desulfarculaceae bacterium]MCF8101844.1 transcriptional repressor [Desulfarculaceae bacterium]MCF8115371.1 transcriptional repressor [Desulfarculaceae bacterium]
MSGNLHDEERRQFERLLRQQGINRLADRLAVLEAFLSSEEHQSAAQVNENLEASGRILEPGFVSETLEMLTRFGLASSRHFDNQPDLYEHRHLGEHHDHLICTKCGSITEFHHPELEELKQNAAAEHGFHHLSHRLQIYGLCDQCRKRRTPTLPLTLAAPGERVRVERMSGGEQSQRHLTDLGISLGGELEVISTSGGAMVVAVGGTRLALGQGVAAKVQVSLIGHQ